VLRALDRDPSFRLTPIEGLRVFFVGNLSRYLPGTVWFAASRLLLGSRLGARPEALGASMVLELLLIVTAGAMITIATIPATLRDTVQGWPAAIAALAGLLALHPRAAAWALNRLARRRGVVPLRPLPYPRALSLLAGYLGVWVIAAGALFATASLVSPLTLADYPAIANAWAIAFLLGLIAPFTPAGLGVREATLTVLLSRLMPLEAAAEAALAFRVLLTGTEALCVLPLLPGVAAIIRRR
jgi:hypothetical protein